MRTQKMGWSTAQNRSRSVEQQLKVVELSLQNRQQQNNSKTGIRL
jgi:hypothetical protein